MHPVGFWAHEGVQVLVFCGAFSRRMVQAFVRGAGSPRDVWVIAAHDGKSFPYGGSDRLVGTLCYRAYRAIRTG